MKILKDLIIKPTEPELCTNCTKVKYDNKIPVKIDVQAIFDLLEQNTLANVFCSGCDMLAIANMEGELKVTYTRDEVKFVNYNFVK